MKPSNFTDELKRAFRRPLIQYLLLFLAVFLVYLPTFWFTFVWDDYNMIGYNRSIREWKNIPKFFTDSSTFVYSEVGKATPGGAWRPLRNVYFLITYKLHNLRPAGWHFQQVIIHAICAMLLMGFLRRIFLYAAPSTQTSALSPAILTATWIAAFAWAVHPANTEVLAWMKAADDIIACIFGLTTLILLLPRSHRPTWPAILAASITYPLGLLTKESLPPIAVIYPLLVIILAPSLKHAITNRPAIIASAILIIETIIFLALRHQILGKTAQGQYIAENFSLMMATMTTAIVRYLQLTFWPFWPTVQLGSYYHWPVAHSWLQPEVLLSSTIILATLCVSLALGYRNRIFLAGVCFTILAFLPAANIVPMMQILAERFMYFPLMGVTLSLATLIAWWLKPAPARRAWLPAIISLALVITTQLRLRVWVDEIAFQKSIVTHVPDETRALYNLAIAHYHLGNEDQALPYFIRAAHVRPDRYPPLMHSTYLHSSQLSALVAAKILAENDRYTEAIPLIDLALDIHGALPNEMALKGDLLRLSGQTTQALHYYNLALEHGFNTVGIHLQTARAYETLENYTKSLEHVEKALEVVPDQPTALQMKDDLTTKIQTQATP